MTKFILQPIKSITFGSIPLQDHSSPLLVIFVDKECEFSAVYPSWGLTSEIRDYLSQIIANAIKLSHHNALDGEVVHSLHIFHILHADFILSAEQCSIICGSMDPPIIMRCKISLEKPYA